MRTSPVWWSLDRLAHDRVNGLLVDGVHDCDLLYKECTMGIWLQFNLYSSSMVVKVDVILRCRMSRTQWSVKVEQVDKQVD